MQSEIKQKIQQIIKNYYQKLKSFEFLNINFINNLVQKLQKSKEIIEGSFGQISQFSEKIKNFEISIKEKISERANFLWQKIYEVAELGSDLD